MKTAEEWMEEMFGRLNWSVADTVTLKAIQLDAMKEGMQRASRIAKDFDDDIKFSSLTTKILTTAVQLTTKDLK